MPPGSTDSSATHSRPHASPFRFVVGAAALFIAGCSAFFSVNGLGLLFIGSATAVMIMAASLELGKLVTASFLYRYWRQISVPLRFYLTAAVLLLIGITSLGNYGYLARAYEQTNSQIGLLQQQVQSVQTEIDDTQHQIDSSRAQIGKTSDLGRLDIDKLQQRIAQAGPTLEGSLARLEERRKAAKEKHDLGLQLLSSRMNEVAGVLKAGLASEESAIATLNDRSAMLDRAVDQYTQQGGPGLFKDDGVKRGQQLLAQQHAERQDIAAQIDAHQKKQERLRDEHAATVASIAQQTSAVEDQYRKDLSGLDAEEQSLRKASADDLADAQRQLRGLQDNGQSAAQLGGNEIESMYQRIRTGNEQIRHLREQIAATDIGSYRFVARAFNAGADDVVKWLILVLVLVFDPLAVALTVGFNVAMVSDRKLPGEIAVIPQPPSEDEMIAFFPRGALSRTHKAILAGAAGVIVLAIVVGGVEYGIKTVQQHTRTSSAAIIPGDSFIVLTIHPPQLRQADGGQKLADLLGSAAVKPISAALNDLLSSGFDRDADVYAFVKYPSGRSDETSDHPVMLCGLTARVSDPVAAEAGLSRFYDTFSAALGKSTASAGGAVHSRSMVRFGKGRYLDPQGGFLTFGLTAREAVIIVEVEGDPQHPSAENEMRLCLGGSSAGETSAFGQPPQKLPSRALSGDGAVSLWFDAGRCFAQIPKNVQSQLRYQQLQHTLGFDLLMTLKSSDPSQLQLAADYAYESDRFSGATTPALDVLQKLGPAPATDISGRLMDRCAGTLDFDNLIDQLQRLLGKSHGNTGPAQVVVEKSIASDRQGKFVLTARFDAQAGPPLVAALESMSQ